MSWNRTSTPRILALEFVAFWPVWIWWARRVADETEAAWGLLALGTAAYFVLRNPSGTPASQTVRPAIVGALVAFYTVSYDLTTPIFRAAIAVLTIALTMLWTRGGPWQGGRAPLGAEVRHDGRSTTVMPCYRRARGAWGVAGLFLLALPVASSLQFIAGFPMRLAASNIASWVLQTSGAGVTAEGTGLRWSGGVIEIDSPCSGIRMLWAGLYFGLTSACACRANAIRTLGVLVTAVVAVVLGNALRSAALFYLEAGLLPVTDSWTSIIHTGVGLIVFSGIAAGTLVCARW